LRPDQAILEPVTTAAYLAAVTSQVHLGFSVLVAPYRHPVLNAKMLSTLDVFSGGRVIVGVGVGWMEKEFSALGASFAHRGRVTDEHIQLLRCLWTRDEPKFSGRHYQVSGVTMCPKPAQSPHPPIWSGGITTPALRRAARLSDGWHGMRMSPEDIAGVCRRLKAMREESGQDFSGFEVSLRGGLDITRAEMPVSRLPMRGSPEQVAGDLARYREAGLTYMVVEPRARDADEMAGQLEQLVQKVQPLL
jgi:probable F420-dependent oxidoreductase